VERIRNFQLNPSRGCKENDEIMPPPVFTPQSLPLVWNWEPDPPWEDEVLGHRATSASTKRPGRKNYNAKPLTSIHPDADCPTEIYSSVPHGEVLQSMISTLEEAFSERPIWTRDALAARVSQSPNMPMLRKALQYVGYRFTAGPWRECLIKRGVDPRLDPSHRKYQTIYFRVHDDNVEQKRWYKATALDAYGHARSPFQTFDGKSFTPGNKIWQLCDVSDPLLARLITTAPFRDSCDNASDGWFTNGALAKIRSIMRTKLDAIQLRREVTDGEFAITLEAPDIVLGKRDHKEIIVPLPNIYPTDEEIFKMSERGIHLIRTGARKATIEKGALRSRNRVASRHIINTYEDSDEDLTAPYGLSPRLAHTSNSKAMGPANMIAGATTSDVDGGMGGNKQQKNAVIGNWLSDTHKGATTESFYGAEEIPSDSGRSAMESDEEAQSDPDIPADGY
jgi:general transcription factor 3C polypeptide 5 (transcription factor C subunit 1)